MDVLLVLVVLLELLCVLGLFVSATVYDRLHYSGASTALAPFLLLAAVAIRQPHPYTNPVWNALFVALALFFLNNVLSHAIARVARQRETREVEL
ncbi:MAG TPA: monovalent cation/H(+) antiporter subunit G [Gaiellaceae bacterium]|nr:monovalent cation/H(+) antiporter subunit G [Gaiellaceae bacterium]